MRPPRTRRGLTLEERRHQRRQALLDAGLELFGAKGFATTSVEEICRTAFVSTRNFYEEFENREALLWALGDELFRETYDAMMRATWEPDPTSLLPEVEARLRALAHALLDDPCRARVVFIDLQGASPERQARQRCAHLAFAELVRDTMEHAGLSLPPEGPAVDLFGLAMVGAVFEIMSDWVLREDRSSVSELVDAIVDITMRFGGALLVEQT